MYVIYHKVGSGGIAHAGNSEGDNEEESEDPEGLVADELHPQVADLYVLGVLCIHHYPLLGLGEAEDEEQQADDGVDRHGGEPCASGSGGIHFTVGRQGTDYDRDTYRNDKASYVGKHHTYGCKDCYLICVPGKG